MSTNTNIKIDTKIEADPNCHLCQGIGITEYFDMSRMPEVGT
jgi:hypothetical protein